MICLCCGKPIIESAAEEEKAARWHKKCTRAFFKTKSIPQIDVDEAALEELVNRTVNRGLTVPGVQKKLSLHLSDVTSVPKLTIVDYPTGYILKPQSKDYKSLPEAESFSMKLAEKMGIKTVQNGLISMTGQKDKPLAYITKRADRTADGMLAMEDFCQIGYRLTADKYKSSYERVGKILRDNSSRPGIDLPELFTRIVFCFLTGNSDMHLKNFSLIETEPGSRIYILAPAYDLLPVNVVMPEDTEETALPLNGKKRNITRNDFLTYAENLNINKTAARKMIDRLLEQESTALDFVDGSFMPDEMKEHTRELIISRYSRLKKR